MFETVVSECWCPVLFKNSVFFLRMREALGCVHCLNVSPTLDYALTMEQDTFFFRLESRVLL